MLGGNHFHSKLPYLKPPFSTCLTKQSFIGLCEPVQLFQRLKSDQTESKWEQWCDRMKDIVITRRVLITLLLKRSSITEMIP